MSSAILVANQVTHLDYDKDVDYFGIDGGAYFCMQHNIPMRCAIGDFDSISKEAYDTLQSYCTVVTLPVEKDQVDSEYALHYVHSLGYENITIVGVCGGRQDHFLAMIQLLKYNAFPFVIEDPQNRIYTLEKGVHHIKREMKYLSFFACEPLCITLQGVKYPLDNREIKESDIYLVSNEIIADEAIVTISGKILVIEANSK